jgi:hypothetical protein
VRELLIAMLLVGCSSQSKLPEVVKIPVPVPCIDQMPAAPDLAQDDALLAMDDYRAVLTMWKDRLTAKVAYEELRAIAQACVK